MVDPDVDYDSDRVTNMYNQIYGEYNEEIKNRENITLVKFSNILKLHDAENQNILIICHARKHSTTDVKLILGDDYDRLNIIYNDINETNLYYRDHLSEDLSKNLLSEENEFLKKYKNKFSAIILLHCPFFNIMSQILLENLKKLLKLNGYLILEKSIMFYVLNMYDTDPKNFGKRDDALMLFNRTFYLKHISIVADLTIDNDYKVISIHMLK